MDIPPAQAFYVGAALTPPALKHLKCNSHEPAFPLERAEHDGVRLGEGRASLRSPWRGQNMLAFALGRAGRVGVHFELYHKRAITQ